MVDEQRLWRAIEELKGEIVHLQGVIDRLHEEWRSYRREVNGRLGSVEEWIANRRQELALAAAYAAGAATALVTKGQWKAVAAILGGVGVVGGAGAGVAKAIEVWF